MKPVEIVQDEKHQHLYRVKYDDGITSEELYSKSRANDVLNHYQSYVDAMNRSEALEREKQARMSTEKPAGAFKSKSGTTLPGTKK